MHLSKRQLIVIGAIVLLVLVIGALYMFGGQKPKPPEVSLTMWGTEANEAIEPLVEEYQKLRPNVKVAYTRLAEAGYSEKILNALAAGGGPDVFVIGNRDLTAEQNKLFPVPPATFSLTQLRALFPATVEDDFADASGIYALPLSIDTLALFYNKDIFDRAALIAPPSTWDEFVGVVGKLRVADSRGGVTKAAAALGGSSRTVESAPDILQLLLFQNGAQLVSADGTTAGFSGGGARGKSVHALNFYLQFADAGSSVYTWNESMPRAREAFAAGKVAMILDYRAARAGLAAQSPFLRIGIAPAPQVSKDAAVAFPRYKGLAVSRQSRQGAWAWDFVVNAATVPTFARGYLTVSGESPALRGEIAGKIGDPELDVFARQALFARSWRAPGGAQADAIFDAAIRSVLTGQSDSSTALSRANDQMTQLLQSR